MAKIESFRDLQAYQESCALDYAIFMGIVQGVRHRGAPLGRLLAGRRRNLELLRERDPWNEVADDENSVAVVAHFVDRYDIRVPQLGCRLCFAKKKLLIRVGEVRGARNLDGDNPLEAGVPSPPDIAKVPPAHLLEQLKVADGPPRVGTVSNSLGRAA